MPSNNPIYTPEDNPNLRRFRREGKQVLDLRDDGKWHDISKPGSAAGKGDSRRPSGISREEYERRWNQTFGGGSSDE